ncbi:MAG: hypothetical protein Q8J78_14675, partial [Moraxellaceae bacterium]|nr:hypothetical protein [Moraxellaceae bacterium]
MTTIKAFICLFLPLSPLVQADEIERKWPPHLVPTTQDMGFHGSPKKIKEMTISKILGVTRSAETTFYENGILKEANSNPGSNHLIKFKKGEVASVLLSTSGQSENGENFTIYKKDEKGRAAIITSKSLSSDAVSLKIQGVGVRVINYSKNVITEESFYKDEIISEPTRFRTEISPDGRVSATCYGGKIGELCDRSQAHIAYGLFGITKNVTGQSTATYEYENGVLIRETREEKNPTPKTTSVNFKNYVLDECKNWIKREVLSSDGDNSEEVRDISYY